MKPSTADENKAMTYEEKIQAVINDPVNCGLSPMAPVLAMFLMDYRPIVPPVDVDTNMTSQEIAMELEANVILERNEITKVMLFLGYKLHFSTVQVNDWSMRRI